MVVKNAESATECEIDFRNLDNEIIRQFRSFHANVKSVHCGCTLCTLLMIIVDT